jgi:ABC-2 type transport system ATP-binding protein
MRDVGHRGELFGLLGPNGAGKTTTIRMLNTLLLPTRGVARVLGHDVADDPVAVRRNVGYVFGGDRGFYDRLTARDNLRYFADLYGVDPREQGRRIADLLDLVGLGGKDRQKVEGYSRGMRQRLHIARGMLHRPAVLFLDEPSIGVDPVAARDLRRTVADLAAGGTTVVLTTHYMAEADQLCGRIAIMVDGAVRSLGTPAELKAGLAGGQVLEVEVYGWLGDGVVDSLRAVPGVDAVRVEADAHTQLLTVHSGEGSAVQGYVLRLLDGVRLGRISHRQPTLEDAYVSIVEEQRDGDGDGDGDGVGAGAAPEPARA